MGLWEAELLRVRDWHQLSSLRHVLHEKTHGVRRHMSHTPCLIHLITVSFSSHLQTLQRSVALGQAYGYPYPDNSGAKFMTESRLLAVLAVLAVLPGQACKAWDLYD